MIFSAKAIGIGALLSAVPACAASYSQTKVYDSTNFFEGFNFTSDPDPSGGFVKYVDAETAKNAGMAKISNGAVYLGANYVDKSPNGRPSTRVRSKDAFTTGLFVADIAHMPAGAGKGGSCGIWPAYWTSGPDWPNSGEIDIIEGVNGQKSNAVTLHTVTQQKDATWMCLDPRHHISQQLWCCFQRQRRRCLCHRMGKPFYQCVVLPRGSAAANAVINAGAADLDVAKFGAPLAHFEGNTCNIAERFKSNYIIFNTNFCGGWASREFLKDETCASLAATCDTWVANNPDAFKDAYWLVNSVKIYARND
ncbi:unnamed protein product [Penicillium nalgiovense]|nr:unnamed protein product [Penicillium nalgiovense]